MLRTLSLRLSLVATLCAGLVPACAENDVTEESSDEAVAVYPGKADNYLSPTSMEYSLWGMGDWTLSQEWADKDLATREAEVRSKLDYKFKAYSHYINLYVTDKSVHDTNQGYGGFAGQIRGTSLDWIVEPVDDAGLVWSFIWELEMGGPRDLLDRLPIQVQNDQTFFMVKMPKLSESQLLSGSYSSDFDASKYQGEMEEIQVMVGAEKESVDAWPNYTAMFADDLFDVLIIVGGDYNAERYDLKAAKEMFTWIQGAGFTGGAASFEALNLDSPAFEKDLKVLARTVKVSVRLVHPDMVADSNLNLMRQAIIKGFETADLVIYDGHAGEDPDYSGVVYHYNPRAAISANELAQLNLPEKYQIYVFNGCKTYAAYPDAVYASGTKDQKNLDIISTVNFSWLTMQPFTTSSLINQLTLRRGGQHDPQTYNEILREINKSNNSNVYYGVHGLDDNGHINPYADLSKLCQACGSDADCAGSGNKCIKFDFGRVCGAECTADDGCPTGYFCGDIAAGGSITGKQCMPKGYSCPN